MEVIKNFKIKSGALSALPFGECFYTDNTAVVYMKIHSRLDERELLGVNLNNGVVESFCYDARVFWVSSEITVKQLEE